MSGRSWERRAVGSGVGRWAFRAVITAWVGGLWCVGGLVAPTLFSMLPDRVLAGAIAGRLFSVLGWVGMGSAAYLLFAMLVWERAGAMRQAAFWVVLTMLALALAGHFGIAPLMAQLKADSAGRDVMQSVLRDRFAAWHGVSSVLYLLQCVLGAALVGVSRRIAG